MKLLHLSHDLSVPGFRSAPIRNVVCKKQFACSAGNLTNFNLIKINSYTHSKSK